MLIIEYSELESLVGQEWSTDWMVIDQARINRFADATDDQQWIHVDLARAQSEMGGTIAHGFLTLSLLTPLAYKSLDILGVSKALNYGFNKVRFVSPTPCGASVRLRQRLQSLEAKDGGKLLTRACTLEIKDAARPALVAEWLILVYGDH